MNFNGQAMFCTPVGKLRSRGFTLLELMITIAVLAVLMGLAAPSFSRALAEQRIRSAASEIYFALLAARSSAITRNEEVEISPASGGWGAGWDIHPKGNTALRLKEGGELKDVSITATGGAIVFRASGRAVNAVTFSFVASAFTDIGRCVRLDASGRPVTEKGAC